MSPTGPPPSPPSPPLRILLLHGYTQSGPLFRSKTRALAKHLTRAFPTARFSYPTAPFKLSVADIPGHDPSVPNASEEAAETYGWWRRKDRTIDKGDGEMENEVVYMGEEKGLARIAECIRAEGPFDGVVGFSQGAAAAAMVASLLEGQRRLDAFQAAEKEGGMAYPSNFLGEVDGFVQGPLKFAVCYSGFVAPGRRHRGFYEPWIGTKVLNVKGQVDTVVDEVRTMGLVRACEGGERKVVVHPGGHFVPSQRPWLDAVVGFVKECLEGGGPKEESMEVSAEDMDVPF